MPINVNLYGGRASSRHTSALPFYNQASSSHAQALPKPTPYNLRRFSESPVARTAINAIKGPVAALGWEIRPIEDVAPLPLQERRIKALSASLRRPNEDDSWRSLVEQVVEDILVGAYGAIELGRSTNLDRPLWLWPVDGSSVQVYAAWSGKANEARYAQVTGFSGRVIQLRNDELIYIKANPRTSTPFGLSPLEVAFETVSNLLGATRTAAETASNQQPRGILNLGEGGKPEDVTVFRHYWKHEVEGRGAMPIIGGRPGPEFLPLFKGDDSDMRLAWQEFLTRTIASCFGLSAMAVGLERDVNRNTADAMADRDRSNAIKPMANLLAEHLNREAIHRRLGWTDLELVWTDLEREDEERASRIEGARLDRDTLLPDEARAARGLPPLPGGWGAISATQRKVLIAQASGTKVETVNPLLQDLLKDALAPDAREGGTGAGPEPDGTDDGESSESGAPLKKEDEGDPDAEE